MQIEFAISRLERSMLSIERAFNYILVGSVYVTHFFLLLLSLVLQGEKDLINGGLHTDQNQAKSKETSARTAFISVSKTRFSILV